MRLSNILKIRLFVLKHTFLVSITLLCFSCEEFCEESDRVAIVVNFYSTEDGKLLSKNLVVKAFRTDNSLHDSILYVRAGYQQVLLPLDPNSDKMKFLFEYNIFSEGAPEEYSTDTIVFHYSRHNAFISAECGCVTMGILDGLPESTKNEIQKIEVVRPKIKTVSYRQGVINEENIKIYY